MNKQCKQCGETKDINEFGKNKSRTDGLAFYCKICNLKKLKEWKKDNPDKVKLYDKRKRAKNPDLYKKAHRKWVIKNRSRRIKTMREWRKKNPEKSMQYYCTARKKDLDGWRLKKRMERARRRAKEKETDLTFKDLKILLKKAIEYSKCPLCNQNAQNWELEHAIPISRDGTHTKNNVYYCCPRCNKRKANKTLQEYANINFKDLPITL